MQTEHIKQPPVCVQLGGRTEQGATQQGRAGGVPISALCTPSPFLVNNSNNSITTPPAQGKIDPNTGEILPQNLPTAGKLNHPTASHRKSAAALSWNVKALSDRYRIQRLGFLTLTFADHVLDPKEAQRRLNSLTTNVLKKRYQGDIRVFERQKSGRIHYHLLVGLGSDIRTGANFHEFTQGDYRSASPALRAEWAFWRKTAKAYGFGRTELLPIKSTDKAIAAYVGKYISKHIESREPRDKGVRLVSYSGPARYATTRFQWASPGMKQWRKKAALAARILAYGKGISHPTEDTLRRLYGPRWAFKLREFILSLPDFPPNSTGLVPTLHPGSHSAGQPPPFHQTHVDAFLDRRRPPGASWGVAPSETSCICYSP